MTAVTELQAGLVLLRDATYYKQTKANWGVAFPQCLLGQAEAAFMTKVPTRPVVENGLDLLRRSWAYQKTESTNPLTFKQTKMGKAEASFVRARDLLPAPVTGLGLFSGPGVFCINPNGGVEDGDIYAKAGFKWAAANVGDYSSEMWGFWRRRMSQFGVTPIPWMRCYTSADLVKVISVANQWGSPACCPNVEAEAMTTLTPYIAAPVLDGNRNLRYGWVTEPWMQNGAGWQELGQRNVVAMCESFLNADPRWQPSVLRDHARSQGMPLFSPVFGAGIWSDAPINVPPSTYFSDWPVGPYGVYPIDGKDALAWKRP